MVDAKTILKKYWHYDSFRPLQAEIIAHVLTGHDTLAILPTGGGKSICYQIPAMVMKGNCLVVSPLIALIKDQALGLTKHGIPCLAIHSGMSKKEVEQTFIKMTTGDYKFIFVSPERLKSNLFLDYVTEWNIGLLAIDEAHCISQWGYDFRPPYLEIAALKTYLPNVPIIALTASATPLVQNDIMEKLAFKKTIPFFTTFLRHNISFSCFNVDNKLLKAIDVLQKIKGSAIVYCKNRRRTKDVATSLLNAGLSADYYHAGLEQNIRSQKQDDWIKNKTNIIVCTNAFGMGIDKPDVRCVIHYDIPDTPEAYYQEAGRAGRDGIKSYAVMLYQTLDLKQLHENIELKYPPLAKMKMTYEALANYLQIGIGSGEMDIFDFDVIDFCKKFSLNLIETMSTMKLLEQQNFWQLSESIYLPSRVHVMANKSMLEELEKTHPALDEILKHLLRMYGGILNHYLPISEFQIAQKIGVGKDYIIHILSQLHHHGIIDYAASNGQPQISFLHDRVDTNYLQIDVALMNRLKLRYKERVEFMLSYVTNDFVCRSTKLVDFFGEQQFIDCQKCDVCLKRKINLTEEEFTKIKNVILHEINRDVAINIKKIIHQFSTIKQELVMIVIRYLLDEKIVMLNKIGDLEIVK
jgi:ATP-dependent DNA helicase RecQ